MPRKKSKKMPRALKPLRWTIDLASAEFGYDRKTLAKRITAASIVPGTDGKFSTSEICRAVFSDGEAARTALAISQRENFDLKNAKLAEKLADKDLFQKISDGVIIELRQLIADAPIPEDVKESILKNIQKINIDDFVKENPTVDPSDLEE